MYGKREISNGKYSTVVAKFLNIKKEGGTTLPVTSPGTQRRNFTHVDDIVDGLILVALKGEGDHYGIGSPESFNILELAKMIGLQPTMMPKVKGNRATADVFSQKTIELGWSAKNNLKDYIKASL